MSSFSQKRTSDFVRAYRSMLNDISKPRSLPRAPSNSRMYNPATTVTTSEASTVFFPLFYAGEKGALGIWEKRGGVGAIKRRLDDEDRSFHVLELSNPRTNLGTSISAPKSALNALHITLPHLIIAMKNYRRNFAFDVLIMDSNAYRRRFSFATWYNPSSLKKFSFMCQVPLRLEIGWNEIHVNFNDLVKNTYKTSYVETIRIQIYANCKLRQVFFCDDKVIEGEIPVPSMRDFENIRVIPLDYGPRTHPDTIEHGPDRKRDIPYVDPPSLIPFSRLESDLKHLQGRRFNDVSKQRLMLQPYKTYFRELLHEQKNKKRVEAIAAAALKNESLTANNSNNNNDSNDSSITSKTNSSSGNNVEDEKIPTLADIRDMLHQTQSKITSDGIVKKQKVKGQRNPNQNGQSGRNTSTSASNASPSSSYSSTTGQKKITFKTKEQSGPRSYPQAATPHKTRPTSPKSKFEYF